jgi:hypothetical protein
MVPDMPTGRIDPRYGDPQSSHHRGRTSKPCSRTPSSIGSSPSALTVARTLFLWGESGTTGRSPSAPVLTSRSSATSTPTSGRRGGLLDGAAGVALVLLAVALTSSLLGPAIPAVVISRRGSGPNSRPKNELVCTYPWIGRCCGLACSLQHPSCVLRGSAPAGCSRRRERRLGRRAEPHPFHGATRRKAAPQADALRDPDEHTAPPHPDGSHEAAQDEKSLPIQDCDC